MKNGKLLFILSIILMLVSCNKEGHDAPLLYKDEIIVSGEKGSHKFNFDSDSDWEASSSKGWCTLGQTSGGKGLNLITLHVEQNSSLSDSREAVILITNRRGTSTFRVVQYPVKTVVISQKSISFSGNDEDKEVAVTSNTRLNLEIEYSNEEDQRWLKATYNEQSMDPSNTNIKRYLWLHVYENDNIPERSCKLILKSSDYMIADTLTILQQSRFIAISNEEDLIAFKKKGERSFDTFGYLKNDITLTQDWQPIGDLKNPFRGIFDGNGFTIRNMNIRDIKAKSRGLFGETQDRVAYYYGQSDITVIKNLTLEGTIEGGTEVGGFVGKGFKTNLYNCVNKVNITGGTYVGGFIGYQTQGTVEKCINYGNLKGSNVGGISGYIYQTAFVRACTNNGTLYGLSGAAGIIAFYRPSSNNIGVENCLNNGAITGPQINAGIIGASSPEISTVISNCKNTASIEKGCGIAGAISKTVVRNCYNVGRMDGGYALVRNIDDESIVKNCYSTADAFLFRRITDSNIENCYYLKYEGKDYPDSKGEYEGKSPEELKTKSTYSGWSIGTDDQKPWVILDNELPKLYWEK